MKKEDVPILTHPPCRYGTSSVKLFAAGERAVSVSCLTTASEMAVVLSVVVPVGVPPGGSASVVVAGVPPSRAVPVSAGIVVGLLVVPTPVACKHRRTSLIEVIPVGVVAVDIERHMTVIPRKWTVEVRQPEVLVVLIDSQDELKVFVSPVSP